MSVSPSTSITFGLWLALRLWLDQFCTHSTSCKSIVNRPEIVTPLTGWKQLQEGLYLFREGYDPYDGDLFHQSPLLLFLFSLVTRPILISILYAIIDCWTAWLLLRLFRLKWPRSVDQVVFKKRDRWMLEPHYQLQDWQLLACYLFSPLQVLTSLSKSTIVFSNLSILLALTAALDDQLVLSMFSISIGTHLTLYPALLLPSCISIICQRRHDAVRDHRWIAQLPTIGKSLATYATHFSSLSICLLIPFKTLFSSVFLSQVDVNKHLNPNIGLHWYFSIEMFDHFRPFFNFVFRIHIVIFILPLLIKFSKERVFGFVFMNGIISTFKSYPSISDVNLSIFLLLSTYPEILTLSKTDLRHPLLTTTLYFYALMLLPTFYHQWIEIGSGNANFYYASTLVWGLGNGLFWIDCLGAVLRRQFEIDLGREIDEEVEALIQI